MSAAINRLLLALWCAAPSRWFRKGAAHDDTKRKSPSTDQDARGSR